MLKKIIHGILNKISHSNRTAYLSFIKYYLIYSVFSVVSDFLSEQHAFLASFLQSAPHDFASLSVQFSFLQSPLQDLVSVEHAFLFSPEHSLASLPFSAQHAFLLSVESLTISVATSSDGVDFASLHEIVKMLNNTIAKIPFNSFII